MSFRRLFGIGVCLALLSAYAVLPVFFAKNSLALTAAGDGSAWVLILFSAVISGRNAFRERGQARAFWAFLSAGCFIWSVNMGSWVYYEVLLRREVPEPFFADVVLFLHVVPLIAAMAIQPHYAHQKEKLQLSTLNFLMLLIWWTFLYSFAVFPDEYVVLNKAVYTYNFDLLYGLENVVLLSTLAFFVFKTTGAWRKIYIGIFVARAVYAFGSTLINTAIRHETYYTGSAYDIPLLAGVLVLIWVFLQAPRWKPEPVPVTSTSPRWRMLPTRLAMLAILSSPAFGIWALFNDPDPSRRKFRLAVSFACMLVLGLFVFIRQSLMDHELLRLLNESRTSFENLQRVQSKLIQKEKLASLGQLAAGAAHEINNPLTAILGYSELLVERGSSAEDKAMATKIAQQARRTRDLVSRLLNFAHQSPSAKSLVDVGALVQRCLQLDPLRVGDRKVAVSTNIPDGLPRVWGSATQLTHCFMQIIGNACDAMAETSNIEFSVSLQQDGNELVLQFSDSGPGIDDPQRVFDPFYTTKEVGKGAGLGLSATYGIVQDHGGQIICENRAEGGATFIMRLPVAPQEVAATHELITT